MEQNQESIFGLSLDQPVRTHLSETASWGRFLGIVGMIFCALFVVVGIFMAFSANTMDNEFRELSGESSISTSGLGTMMFVVYILLALLYFFPCLYLLRFSNKMKVALSANDQVQLTNSFQNLKVLFRFLGILTIIMLSFWILALVAGGAGFMLGS